MIDFKVQANRADLSVFDGGSPVTWLTDDQYKPLPLKEKMLIVASTQVGVRERGRNSGSEIESYVGVAGFNPMTRPAYCAIGVYWSISWAAWGEPSILAKFPRFPENGRVRGWVSWARKRGALKDSPERGDLMFWLRKDGKGHIGMVTGVVRAFGRVVGVKTIEFNTAGEASGHDDSKQREGDGVHRRTRLFVAMKLYSRGGTYGFISID